MFYSCENLKILGWQCISYETRQDYIFRREKNDEYGAFFFSIKNKLG